MLGLGLKHMRGNRVHSLWAVESNGHHVAMLLGENGRI